MNIEKGKVEVGKVTIVPAPHRGRVPEPIPENLIATVIEALGIVGEGELVSTGLKFEKASRAQTRRKPFLEALAKTDPRWNKDSLGTSVIDLEGNPARKDSKGPFVL